MGQPIRQNGVSDALNTPTLPRMRAVAAPHPAIKVPEVTVFFWIAKLLSTALGESTSDYLVFHIDPYVAVALGGVGLVVALGLQFYVRRYVPWIYWLAVIMVAIFGTMAADVVHIVLHVPYVASTIFFIGALAVIFAVWYYSERTLSIHSISSLRREAFYWTTVMTTFALGTAAGDMTASTLNLGYFASGLLFMGLITLPLLGYRLLRLNPIVAFWCAYILTRPLGASFADWTGKDQSVRGLGWGDAPVSSVLFLLIVAVVAYLTITRADVSKNDPRVNSTARR
jgi:uncharacterized membrane-anchored protein